VAADAWQRGQTVVVHGWVYGLHDGLLQDLQINVGGADQVGLAYDAALALLKQRWRLRQAEA
jgi:carbonic anhydrase